MRHVIDLPVLDGEHLEIDASGFFSKPKVYHNGELVREKSTGTKLYQLKTAIGKLVNVEVEDSFFEEAPIVKVNGRHVSFEAPSSSFVKFLAYFPMIVAVLGMFFGELPTGVVLFLTLPFAALSMRSLRLKSKSIIKICVLSIGFIVSAIVGILVLFSIFGHVTLITAPVT